MSYICLSSYVFPLALLYLGITIYVTYQLGRIYYYGHKFFGWQFGFLSLCFIWGTLRFIYWFWQCKIGDVTWEGIILQGLGINIQVATFSFLILYYACSLDRSQEKYSYFLMYFLSNAITWILFFVVLTLQYLFGLDEEDWVENSLNVGKTALLFFFLVIALTYYGNTLSYAIQHSQPGPFSDKRVTKTKLDIVTRTLVISFATRVIRDTIAAAGWGTLDVDSDAELIYQVILFSMYFFWEIIPIVLVLWMCGFVPKVLLYKTVSEESTPILPKRPISIHPNIPIEHDALEINPSSGEYDRERLNDREDIDDVLKNNKNRSSEDDDEDDEEETDRKLLVIDPAILLRVPFNQYPTESPFSQSFPRWSSDDSISFPNHQHLHLSKSHPEK